MRDDELKQKEVWDSSVYVPVPRAPEPGLDVVRRMMAGTTWSQDTGKSAWALVSALRGPDDENPNLKRRTTNRLRAAIAPEFFNVSALDRVPLDRPEAGEFEGQFKDRVVNQIRIEFPDAQGHFLFHYADACWVYSREGGRT